MMARSFLQINLLLLYMRRFTSTVPNRAISAHVYDTKAYLKKFYDKHF